MLLSSPTVPHLHLQDFLQYIQQLPTVPILFWKVHSENFLMAVEIIIIHQTLIALGMYDLHEDMDYG